MQLLHLSRREDQQEMWDKQHMGGWEGWGGGGRGWGGSLFMFSLRYDGTAALMLWLWWRLA